MAIRSMMAVLPAVPLKTRNRSVNGALEQGEACDDGNLVDDDGCSAAPEETRAVVVMAPLNPVKRVMTETRKMATDVQRRVRRRVTPHCTLR